MNTLTLYLDIIILASAAYPSGFSNSLFNSWKGTARGASTGFLLLLALPYPVIALAVWGVRPELLSWRGTSMGMMLAALAVAPLALLVEYCVHALAAYRRTGAMPRGIALQAFWRRRLSPLDHALLLAVAVGEEILYRGIWLSALLSMGVPAVAAACLSAAAYGLNHLAFGGRAVFSKTLTGLLYCALYLAGGRSIWLPVASHVAQNLLLFALAKEQRERDA